MSELSWQNPPDFLLELICEHLIKDVLCVNLGFHDPVSLGRRLRAFASTPSAIAATTPVTVEDVTCSCSHSFQEDSRKDPHASISVLLSSDDAAFVDDSSRSVVDVEDPFATVGRVLASLLLTSRGWRDQVSFLKETLWYFAFQHIQNGSFLVPVCRCCGLFPTHLLHVDQRRNAWLRSWQRDTWQGFNPDAFGLRSPEDAMQMARDELVMSGDPVVPDLALFLRAIGAPYPAPVNEEACWSCNLATSQSPCSTCKMVRFCSEECERELWPRHTRTCSNLASFSGLRNRYTQLATARDVTLAKHVFSRFSSRIGDIGSTDERLRGILLDAGSSWTALAGCLYKLHCAVRGIAAAWIEANYSHKDDQVANIEQDGYWMALFECDLLAGCSREALLPAVFARGCKRPNSNSHDTPLDTVHALLVASEDLRTTRTWRESCQRKIPVDLNRTFTMMERIVFPNATEIRISEALELHLGPLFDLDGENVREHDIVKRLQAGWRQAEFEGSYTSGNECSFLRGCRGETGTSLQQLAGIAHATCPSVTVQIKSGIPIVLNAVFAFLCERYGLHVSLLCKFPLHVLSRIDFDSSTSPLFVDAFNDLKFMDSAETVEFGISLIRSRMAPQYWNEAMLPSSPIEVACRVLRNLFSRSPSPAMHLLGAQLSVDLLDTDFVDEFDRTSLNGVVLEYRLHSPNSREFDEQLSRTPTDRVAARFDMVKIRMFQRFVKSATWRVGAAGVCSQFPFFHESDIL